MTKPKDKLTQAALRFWLRYEPDTGRFFWREKPGRSIAVGSEAGSFQSQHGKVRRMLWVEGRRMYASRAAYVYVHGDISSTALVDHINGDTTDDRIDNLRLASTTQNTWNRVQREGSEYKLGVSKSERGRFKARVQLPNGTKLNLGTWDTEEEAHACYMGAAAILHSEFWIGNRAADVLDFTKVRAAK